MDNAGPYISKAQLLPEIIGAGLGGSKPVTLSNLTGSTFDFAGVSGTDVPVVGDWVLQGTFAAVVSALPASGKISLDFVAGFANGPASLLKLATPQSRLALDTVIALAMQFVDRSTRWWFNSRSFTAKIEGNNTDVLLLNVPILSLTQIVMNEEMTFVGTDLTDTFLFPNARTYPDDRRNPRIKLRRDVRNVFLDVRRAQTFRRGRMQALTGAFGFLEEDGATPALIQRATMKYAILKYVDPPGVSAAATEAQTLQGPLVREKTDLHEMQWAEPGKSVLTSASSPKGMQPLSGDREIDDILLMYRGPILLGGSFMDEGVEAPRFYGGLS